MASCELNLAGRTWISVLILLGCTLSSLFAQSSQRFKTSTYGCSENTGSGYIAVLERDGTSWRLKRIGFDGSVKVGPIVNHAIDALALSETIAVPCSTGKVEIFSENLEPIWSFHVDEPKNIALGAKIDDINSIALLTLDVAKQEKWVEVFSLDHVRRKASRSRMVAADFIGGLATFASSVWLLNQDSSQLVIDGSD